MGLRRESGLQGRGAACPAGLGLRFAESGGEAGRKAGGFGSFLFIIPTLMRDVTYFLRVG